MGTLSEVWLMDCPACGQTIMYEQGAARRAVLAHKRLCGDEERLAELMAEPGWELLERRLNGDS